MRAYDRALALNPTFAEAFNNRGFEYARRGDYDRAVEDYDDAIRFNPRLAMAFNNRSLAYAHKGEYRHAIADGGHFLWLKFGVLGIAMRLCVVALVFASGFAIERFRKRATMIRISES